MKWPVLASSGAKGRRWAVRLRGVSAGMRSVAVMALVCAVVTSVKYLAAALPD